MECSRCKRSLAYEKVVQEVNKRMSEVEKTPEALSQAAMDSVWCEYHTGIPDGGQEQWIDEDAGVQSDRGRIK